MTNVHKNFLLQKWNKNSVSLGDAWGICIICILLKNVLNYKRYCGWDIHKDSILPKNFKTEIKQFATTTEEVEELKVWLKNHPVG